jgi:hypothetical protein
MGEQGLISGVAGGSAASLAYLIWVWLDEREIPCRVQADFVGSERILGRDVLNRLDALFRGPSAEVVVNPRRAQLAERLAPWTAQRKGKASAINVRRAVAEG